MFFLHISGIHGICHVSAAILQKIFVTKSESDATGIPAALLFKFALEVTVLPDT